MHVYNFLNAAKYSRSSLLNILSTDRIKIKSHDSFLSLYSKLPRTSCEKIESEMRGLVVNSDTYEIVNYGFDKFFSIENVPKYYESIPWVLEEKVDGALVKVSNLNSTLLISSNHMVDAQFATFNESNVDLEDFSTISSSTSPHSTGDNKKGFPISASIKNLFLKTFPLPHSCLPPESSTIFELVHPLLPSVIPSDSPKLIHLGTRSLKPPFHLSVDSIFPEDLIGRPQIIANSVSIAKAKMWVRSLPWNREGGILRPPVSYFSKIDPSIRVKVKNPSFVARHSILNSHAFNLPLQAEAVFEYLISSGPSLTLNMPPSLVTALKPFQECLDDFCVRIHRASLASNSQERVMHASQLAEYVGLRTRLSSEERDCLESVLRTLWVERIKNNDLGAINNIDRTRILLKRGGAQGQWLNRWLIK